MAASVGTAYLTLVPKMESGWKSSVSNEVLPASEKLGEDAGKKSGDGFSLSFGSAVKTLAKSAAVVKGAKLVGSTFADAFAKYADYQQLEGGVSKLFGDDAAAEVMRNARAAFETAGLNANEYMETVTGFSASLISSLGGDTARAAEIADEAIRDMSDNANTFGTDMSSIQAAYQGFAKQNYTMLDNLKLGYGGTKTEMERLIADANVLRAEQGKTADLTIESYADIIEAINAVQRAQNIYGTTANEAAGTVSGAIAMTQSAWGNLLIALGDPNGDIDAAMGNLLSSIEALAKNVFPVAVQIGSAIIQGVIKGVAGIGSEIEKAVMGGLNGLMGGDQSTMDSAWSSYQDFLSSGNYGVPMYASGGYFEAGKPRRGVLGDGSYDEAALPLSPGVFARMGEGIRDAMGGMPGGGDTIIINGITVDGGSSAARAVRAMVDAVGVRSRS